MTSGPHAQAVSAPESQHGLRLRLKPKAPTTGYVDGGWCRHLAAALPALAEILAVRLGPVTRVAFALAAWDTAPRGVPRSMVIRSG